MQALVKAWVFFGNDHLRAETGGENLSGGLAAKGIPRNLLTRTFEDGITVVVPMTAPESIVAVGSETVRWCTWT